ncbi:MAG: DUF2059 domain-containing protein [Erythrobacter sp.]
MRFFPLLSPFRAGLAATILMGMPAQAALAAEESAPADAAAEPARAETPSTSPNDATTINPEAMSLAAEIVRIGYPEEKREALFFGTMDATVVQMRGAIAPSLPKDDPAVLVILDEWIAEYTQESKLVLRKHIPAIMVGMTQAYATIFTLEELDDILAFVTTPSGQRYFELSPAVMGEKGFADANQRYLDESVAMLGPAQKELQSRLQEYFAKKASSSASPDT